MRVFAERTQRTAQRDNSSLDGPAEREYERREGARRKVAAGGP